MVPGALFESGHSEPGEESYHSFASLQDFEYKAKVVNRTEGVSRTNHKTLRRAQDDLFESESSTSGQ